MIEVDIVVNLPDDCKIVVHCFRNGKPPLCLFHANGFPCGTYRRLIFNLLEDFEVHAVDLRGQGDSERGSVAVKLDCWQHAQDITHVMNFLDLKKCHAFGHSMGGTAILCVEQIYPGYYFECAALYEPALVLRTQGKKNTSIAKLASLARARKRDFSSRQAAYENFVRKPPFSHFEVHALHDYVNYGFKTKTVLGDNEEIELKTSPENESQTFKDFSQPQFILPKKINLRTLVLVGNPTSDLHSEVREESTALVRNLPNGELKTFQGLSHFGPFEDPENVAKHSLQFFRRNKTPISKL